MNSIWITTAVSPLHVWVTKFKTFFIFFKLSILTSNKVVWMPFPAILFDETQHVVKTPTTGYVPVFYEVINLFIKLQNFLLMLLISKLKGFYLIVTVCDGLSMFFLDLFNPCIKSTWCDFLQNVVLKRLALAFLRVYDDIKGTGQRDENIMVLSIFPGGVHNMNTSFSLQKGPSFLIFVS